ncbi:FtsW/RodA/SpoVE family cell cycle protein [Clostridium septicum]|uniref:FtsW/RodA/SpoVE family cell cycle protein n=1 Tax=Clostridium septicum TaxID=1504 RepID=A0A9N7JLV9_CLOSE|nr:FtsW/RodA/SpoVE family cell cycle protein [Clostridium septicum]AYE34132.1 FtsW/RodA/SpoVE family cell cycle protein [Clostridium septicum]MDU1313070.1 FtsW/RodA/SpoVE family cell cycle protein [Clostridium septicum]QAS59499.1 FtsW/RodA/SpoVE family cell cycle protein [Clostridium septicum]UEC21240.1 FtsW/RodA/SpoVE family cell cycle protein [Clostridium septicum]USS00714.1 FtsW/RodA/SpoVE family cell cycle protein [Clostridium septicum]
MKSTLKLEKRVLKLIYLLCLLLFTNLALLKKPFDYKALGMGVILCLIIGYSHYVIRKFYPDGDKFMLIFSSILAVVGIAVIYRINPSEAMKQLIWVVLGIISYIAIVVILPDLKSFAKYKRIYMILTLVLMPMALILGKEIYGAKNWVYVAGFGFQPSEFGKIALVLYLAAALMKYESKKNLKEEFKQLIEPALIAMYSLACMVLQTDLGSALIFFGISVTMLYIATSKKKYVFTCLGLSAIGAVGAYKMFGHVRNRVMIWLDPWKYANDQGMQIVQGLYAISSGGLFGVGLGKGYPEFIPVNTSDFIFAVVCEELGMIFAVGIMIIYFLLFYRGIRAAFVTNEKFSQLSAVGFSTMIACQTLVIIGGIFKVIPLTGITLPLISYGGSSMITIFFTLGILQKISEEA